MATRFPQGTGNLAYRIKPAWASKIKAIYWAVAADTVQRLLPGDTVTTPISRAASGAGFDAANGFITGTNSATLFTDGIDGGIGGLKENDNFVFGASYYGDMFNGGSSGHTWLGSSPPPDIFSNGFSIKSDGYAPVWVVQDGAGGGRGSEFSNDVAGWMTLAIRRDVADPIAAIRVWARTEAAASGAEFTDERVTSGSSSGTDLIGTVARPIYFGATHAGTGNTSAKFECCFLAGVLSDADMVTLVTNPADVIEVAAPSITITPDPSSVSIGSNQTMTITRTTAAPAGGVTYNLTSGTPATATVPATATILEGNTSVTFTATSVGIGTTVITATNAADSGETDSVTHNVTSVLVKKAKFIVHSDFQSATNITIDVFQAPGAGALTGARLGAASGINAEATLEGGQAVIKVPATSIGATGLSVGTSVRAVFKGTTSASSPLGNAVEGGSVATATGSIIEE